MSAMLYWSAARYLCPFLRWSSMTPYSLQHSRLCSAGSAAAGILCRTCHYRSQAAVPICRPLQGTIPKMLHVAHVTTHMPSQDSKL